MSLGERSASILSVADAQRILPPELEKHEIEKEFPKGLLHSLVEKNYEKRKQAGHNLQRFIKDHLLPERSSEILEKCLSFFHDAYLLSLDDAYRQAGLMAYSAIASSLTSSVNSSYIESLITHVLSCSRDNNPKVKYYAVESLYNITKVCRQNVLFLFPQIFKAIVDLCTGIDKDVKKATKKLDSLLKTIVVECEANERLFDANKFMVLIMEMTTGSRNAYVQRMIVAWLTVLDSIPEFQLFKFTQSFIKGVFLMLKNTDNKLHNDVLVFLNDLLREIKNDFENPVLNIKFIMATIVEMIELNENSIKIEAISWIHELTDKAGTVMISNFPMILKASLECLSDQNPEIIQKAENTNIQLLGYCRTYVKETNSLFNATLTQMVKIFMQYITNDSIKVRETALQWVTFLQENCPESLESSTEILVTTLSSRLSDSVYSIVNDTLQILCSIAQYKQGFSKVISSILAEFAKTDLFSIEVIKTTVKSLCQTLGTKLVYTSIAELLYLQANLGFCKKIIEVLNELLLIDNDYEEDRERLKYCMEKDDKEFIEFFEGIYRAWCFNPGCALTLVFLVQSYGLAYEIIYVIARVYISTELLLQLAKVVQLIDSPVFLHLRIQMLQFQQHPYLLKSLYAILMILPPSKAYKTLKRRLKDVSSMQRSFCYRAVYPLNYSRCERNKELIQYFVTANDQLKRSDRLEIVG